MKLSVLMPAFNEERHLEDVVNLVLATPQDKEIILVDDGSSDQTAAVMTRLSQRPGVTALFHSRNLGKGAAVQTALAAATGDVVVLQDCDLEYDPRDYTALLRPIEAGEADAVYGRRELSRKNSFSLVFFLGNRFLAAWTNVLFSADIHDLMTAYKVMRIDVARRLELTEPGYGIEPEITGTLFNLGYRVREVPIWYRPRNRQEGKKPQWHAGIGIAVTLLRVRLRRRRMRRRALPRLPVR